jgi:hypothetical protein
MLGSGRLRLGNGHGQFGVDGVGSVGNGVVVESGDPDGDPDGVLRIVGSAVFVPSTAEVDGC